MASKLKTQSLRSRESPLSDTFIQLKVLRTGTAGNADSPGFAGHLKNAGIDRLRPLKPEILQINIGKMCNQTCAHCHVDAGPDRTEKMSERHMIRCLEILRQTGIGTVDITGGAPEMHPHFRWFVEQCRALNCRVIVRSNLTILVANKKYRELPAFFAAHRVEVTSSLPYFSKLRTDRQRGEGVFDDSIRAIRLLNEEGYGLPETGLELNLVYNPTGAFLPDSQHALEEEFRKQLLQKHGVVFNRLFTITNVPISRFLDYLLESGNYDEYMDKLISAFNPATLNGLMCRNTLSVSWDGYLYDCDFNQMLELGVSAPGSEHIDRFDMDSLIQRSIVTDVHCFACTAGAGSSCGGELV